MKNISPQEAAQAIKENAQALLIDVRSGKEYQTVHAAGAQLFPLDQITEERASQLCHGNKDTPLYVLCQSGVRAQAGSAKLDKMGFSKVHCVEGGTIAWEAKGLPVERGQGVCFSLGGLALLIAKMPWNRTQIQTGTCCCSLEKTHE